VRARFNAFLFTTGAALVRNQLFVRFEGADTVAGIRGATLLNGSQHADLTLFAEHAAHRLHQPRAVQVGARRPRPQRLPGQDHRAPGGAADRCPHGDPTRCCLTDDAEADNKPELEITPTTCNAATARPRGRLDQDLLFYLKARGIPEKEAETLLIQAFVGEAVEGIEHAACAMR